MTEIERYTAPTAAVDSWVPVMGDVIKLAQYVSETEFVPKALRNKPAAVAAAILAGREAGVPPMTALQHMHMVDGRPSMSAERKRAQALAAGHSIVYEETSTTRCVVKGRRRGSDHWTTVTWTLDDAKLAGLLGRENWKKYPRRMLQARATAELCDVLFPDATSGIATYEELLDDAGDYTETADGATPTKPARRTARRRTKPAEPPQQESGGGSAPAPEKPSPPEPPLPGEEGYDDEPAEQSEAEQGNPESDASPQPVTPKQLPKLLAMFGDAGWTDRDDRLRAASVIVGRQIGSFNDLTKDDASALIDTLELVCRDPDPQLRLTEFIERASGGEVHEGEIVEEAP